MSCGAIAWLAAACQVMGWIFQCFLRAASIYLWWFSRAFVDINEAYLFKIADFSTLLLLVELKMTVYYQQPPGDWLQVVPGTSMR
jgi:hypothetical protein